MHASSIRHNMAAVSGAVALALTVVSAVPLPAFANSIVNRIPGTPTGHGVRHSRNSIRNTVAAAVPVSPCRRASSGPVFTGCLSLGGLTPEVRLLSRLACLLERSERWKLSAVACAGHKVQQWRPTVAWPPAVIEPLRTAARARAGVLRQHYEDVIEDWSHPAARQSLASIYGAPKIVARSEYEATWAPRPSRHTDDAGGVASWLPETRAVAPRRAWHATAAVADELQTGARRPSARTCPSVRPTASRAPRTGLQPAARRGRIQAQAVAASRTRSHPARHEKPHKPVFACMSPHRFLPRHTWAYLGVTEGMLSNRVASADRCGTVPERVQTRRVSGHGRGTAPSYGRGDGPKREAASAPAGG